ncbi:MAG: hypothetical protein WD048_15955 [Chitinophagales bacterium]
MLTFKIISDNKNFDPEGLAMYCDNVWHDRDVTYSPSLQSQVSKSSTKILIVGTALALTCISDAQAAKEVLFQQDKNENITLENYQNLVDTPFSEYELELNNHFYKKKSVKEELIKEIVSFESLKMNWDGFSAYPLEVESAANAINFINLLADKTISDIEGVLPNSNGTVSVFWENSSGERVSLEIGNNNYSYYVKYNSQKPIFVKGDILDKKEAEKINEFVKTL